MTPPIRFTKFRLADASGKATATPLTVAAGGLRTAGIGRLRTPPGQPGPLPLAGLGAGDHGYVSLGGGSANRSANGDFSMTMDKNGTHDLIGWRHHNLFTNPDRRFIRRDQNIAANGSVGTVDLTGPESFAAASSTITLTGCWRRNI